MNNFRLMANMIALESTDVMLPVKLGTPTFLKVKGIAKAISQWAREKIRPDQRLAVVSYSKLQQELEKANFVDINTVKVTVPRGLKGHLNAYVEELFDAFIMVEHLNKDLLTPFSTWMSLMLASPESLADASAIKDLKDYREIPVDKIRNALGGFVDPTSRKDQMMIKDIYPSITIMKTTWDNINALSTRYLETNPTKILKQVQDISGKVDRLVEMVEKEQGTFSGQTATALAKLVANMAEAVDTYGQLGILIREVAVCGSRQVGELAPYITRSADRARNVATESLKFDKQVLTIQGRTIDLEFLCHLIERKGHEEIVPIDVINWVVDMELTDARMGETDGSWSDSTVYALRYEDAWYPVKNENLIACANAAGHAGVRVLYLKVSELIEMLDKGPQY